jgi:hypothetical protein
MFLINKVMGPHLNSDKEDMVNKDDNCIQHSAFGKEWNSYYFQSLLWHTIVPFYAGPDKFVYTCLITNTNHQKSIHQPSQQGLASKSIMSPMTMMDVVLSKINSRQQEKRAESICYPLHTSCILPSQQVQSLLLCHYYWQTRWTNSNAIP